MENVIFEMDIKVDKNSREFDLGLLEELKALKNIQVNKFNTVVRKIMKKKSSCKLWFDDNTVNEWDGREYRKANYVCCPSSHRARHYFCLVLDKNDNEITVMDGFLSAV